MGVLRGMPRNMSTDIHRGTVGEGGSCGKVMLLQVSVILSGEGD